MSQYPLKDTVTLSEKSRGTPWVSLASSSSLTETLSQKPGKTLPTSP